MIVGMAVLLCAMSAPAQAQFDDGLDGWGNLGPTYESPSYADPYAPTPRYESPTEQLDRSLEPYLPKMDRDAFEANRALDTMLHRGACAGWGVQSWTECD